MSNQIGYFFLEAARGMKGDKYLSATSIITIGICTSVFAFTLIALSLLSALSRQDASDSALRVFLREEAGTPDRLRLFETKLGKIHGLDSIRFIDKKEAIEEFKKEFESGIGEEMLRSIDVNPLPHSYILFPSQAFQSSTQNRLLKDRIALLEEVEAISANSLYLAWVDKLKIPVLLGSSLLLLFMGGALALIVQNAVKLNLYARRSLVDNMKYCGAGEYFIIAPFLLEGVFLGLCGSLVGVASLAFLLLLLRFISPSLPTLVSFWYCAMSIVLVTSAIACVASTRTVRFFLRSGQP